MELLDSGEEDALTRGSVVCFRVRQGRAVARLAPPFRIRCLYTDVEPERRLREIVTGDLNGVLETIFREESGGTRVTFNWYVRITSPALNLLGYAAEGMYRRSHDAVMGSGEAGLRAYLKGGPDT